MQVSNTTTGKVASAPIKRKDGGDSLVVILRYSFVADPHRGVEIDYEAEEPSFIDTYHGEDGGTSSIRCPSELFEHKPGTDVLLLGHAVPPGGKPASVVDVTLRMGPIDKTVRAYGTRAFVRGWSGGVTAGPAEPLRAPVPLKWELAYGGMDLSDPRHPVGEPRNYLGRGVARDPSKLVDSPAAQLEDPKHPLSSAHPAPAGFGAIHRHWDPRIRFAGTYDRDWQEQRCPLPPDDFDDRFNIATAHDQWSASPLRGDEPVEVLGATEDGAWRFQLPRRTPGFSSVVRGARTEHRTHLDGVTIDADRRRVDLTFRAAIPLPLKYEMLESVLVFEKRVV